MKKQIQQKNIIRHIFKGQGYLVVEDYADHHDQQEEHSAAVEEHVVEEELLLAEAIVWKE